MNEEFNGFDDGRNDLESEGGEKKEEYVFDFEPKREDDGSREYDRTQPQQGYAWAGGYANGEGKNGGRVSREIYERRGQMFNDGSDGESRARKQKRKKKILLSLGAVGIAAVGFFGGYFTYRATLDPEMRSLIWAKKQIQQNYYQPITDEEFYDTVFGSVNGMLDPYSYYLTADEYKDMLQDATGEWSGLGVTFSTQGADSNEQLLITRVSGNSPAEAAGILPGMYIVGFGDDENSLTMSESYSEFSAFLDPKAAKEEFTLMLRRGTDGEPFALKIAKASFVENYVFYRSRNSSYIFTGKNATEMQEDPQKNYLSFLDGETAYIRLTQFNGQASEEFAKAMEQFKKEGKKNLILDLRANGGGYMNILSDIAAYFCKSAQGNSPIVAIASYRNGKEEKFAASGNKFHGYFSDDSRISVLADNGTASASECLIGAMLDYGAISYSDIYLSMRGEEAKSFGKGIMQSTRPSSFVGTPDAIKLTTARILWPLTRNCIHDRGVLPEDGANVVAENYEGSAEIEEAWNMISGT